MGLPQTWRHYSVTTHRYHIGGHVSDIMWHGRWRNTKTLESYLQEHAASVYLSTLPQSSQQRVRILASCSWDLLEHLLR